MSPLRCFHNPVILAFASVIGGIFAYEWPSPQYDALEELLYEGIDTLGTPIASLASTCNVTFGPRGPSVAAEWLRLAYHDMATFNITDGTGGLDASILYELDRPENIGDGNVNSLADFRTSMNKHISLADVIAMGAVWAVAGCEGPLIPYRGGRVDARKAGLPGVPEPQQDLETHEEKFRLQGFTPEEMIQMVACGHTIGSVRAADFPDVVKTNGPVVDEFGVPFVESFDSTNTYDTAVVTEYLSGTTKNPLVVNSNVTIQSDLRIFASDGNVTMNSMKSASVFQDTCGKLFERMLNTVPKGVQLTEEIELLPFKIKRAQITVIDKQLMLKVKARVAVSLTGTRKPNTVKLFWCDRRGENAECANDVVNFATSVPDSPFFDGGSSPIPQRMNTSFATYTFRAPITPSLSAGHFWLTVADGDDTPVLQDNGGKRYFIEQDALIAVNQLFNTSDNFKNGEFTRSTQVVVALNTTSTPSLAQVGIFDYTIQHVINVTNTFSPPRNTTQNLVLANHIPPVAGYTFYTANYSDSQFSAELDYTVEVDGARYTLEPVEPPAAVIFGIDGFFGSDSGAPSQVVGKMSLKEALQGLAAPSTTSTAPTNTGTGTSGASAGWTFSVSKYVFMVLLFNIGRYIL